MKKLIYLLCLAVALILLGYYYQKSKQQKGNPLEVKALPPTYGHDYHDITLRHASFLGTDFLGRTLNNYEFGGFFNVIQIKSELQRVAEGHESGLMIYCLFDAGTAPRLFTAFKGVKEYNENDPQLSEALNLYRGIYSFRYTTADYADINRVTARITTVTHAFPANGPLENPQDILPAYAVEKGEAFKTEFAGRTASYNFYLHSNQIVTLISDPNCVGINYYFGFDDTENDNKIRLFFIAVNNAGTPIYRNAATGKYQLILERSFP